MKRKLFILLNLLVFALGASAQSSMTDDQVLRYYQTEIKKGADQKTIAVNLLKKGVTTTQLQRVRRKAQTLQDGNTQSVAPKNNQNRLRTEKEEPIRNGKEQSSVHVGSQMLTGKAGSMESINQNGLYVDAPNDSIIMLMKEAAEGTRKVFGRNIFNNENLSFQPAGNMATPANYHLGAGDEVIIDVWGNSQQTIRETVSPDGTIVVEGVGPIRLAGLSVDQAKNTIKSKLGSRFGGCSFDLSIGETRTIQIQVMGEVNTPGTYSMNGLSTAFNALYAAGGINAIGTLRNIKVYRSGRQIATIDVYDYLINGNSKGDVRLEDNDVIIVGPYDCLVQVEGKVKRPMWYEMKKTENVKQLLRYSGGFTGDAYTKNIRLTRKSGTEYSIHTIDEFDMANFTLDDEDVVMVDGVRARYSNLVEVRGAVMHAGQYQLGKGIQSVRELMQAADGLREDAYVERAIMHREKDDLTLEMISIDIKGIMDGTVSDIPLKKNDVLFIPSKTEMMGERTLRVVGEVVYPGIYPYAEHTTLRDIILQAGGMTSAGSLAKIDISRRITDTNASKSNDRTSGNFSFALNEFFELQQDTTFYLKPFDIVMVRKSPSYEEQKNVAVRGQVNFQGQYAMTRNDYRLSDLIRDCGGTTPSAFIKGAHLTRVMTKEEIEHRDQANDNAQILLYESALKEGKEMNMQIADSLLAMKRNTSFTFPVAIDLDKAIAQPGSDFDLILRKGDVLDIPETSNIIKISGEVMSPVSMVYEKGRNLHYYISHAGGYNNNAQRTKVYGIHANGSVVSLHSNSVRDIQPGIEIIVPQKVAKKKMSTAEIVGITSGAASVGAIIVSVMNILKK